MVKDVDRGISMLDGLGFNPTGLSNLNPPSFGPFKGRSLRAYGMNGLNPPNHGFRVVAIHKVGAINDLL